MTCRTFVQSHRFACIVAALVLGFAISNLCFAADVPVHRPDRSTHVDETAMTSKAIVAVDDHWSLAELRGNTAWMDALLLPGYRSVRADGTVRDKSNLLAHAAKNRGHGVEKLKAFDAWLESHPMNEAVAIHGDTVVLTFSVPATGRIRLYNVFVHENGRWRALYSQLTKAD